MTWVFKPPAMLMDGCMDGWTEGFFLEAKSEKNGR